MSCKEELPLDNFAKNRTTRDRLQYECNSCRSHNRRLTRKLKKEHPAPDRCDCCGAETKLHLDHDHKTMEFRGWLCNRCNQGIGLLQDDVVIIQRAIDYLNNVIQ